MLQGTDPAFPNLAESAGNTQAHRHLGVGMTA
jgi:hypothetical protein